MSRLLLIIAIVAVVYLLLGSRLKQPLLIVRDGLKARRSNLAREYLRVWPKRPSIISACWTQAAL